MNFSPFGTHFSSSIPTIHQFAAKFSQDSPVNNMLCPPPDTNSSRYTANGVPSFTQHHPATPAQQQLAVNNTKYQANYMNQNMVYGGQNNLRQLDKRYEQHQQDVTTTIATDKQHKSESPPHHHIHNNGNNGNQAAPPPPPPQLPSAWQSLAATSGSTVADYLSHLPASTLPISLHHFLKYSAESIKKENTQTGGGGGVGNQGNDLNYIIGNAGHNNGANGILNNGNNHLLNNPNNLSSLTTINTAHLQSNSTNNSPISTSVINTPVVPITVGNNNSNNNNGGALATTTTTSTSASATTKKRKKKKVEKEKKPKPRPGEIRLTTALDGSTLYCCPECHMAYPEKELLEQHLVAGHTLERRFVCDICGAGLKRKDHLTRHKQSHNPERPYVCTVCLKAFKRKEQLTLHFVIHSGEKRHVCSECGKGFYRKDHLRKHTRSHIARRVKAELSQHGAGNGSSGNGVTTPGNTLHLQLASPTSHSVVATNIMS